MESQKKREWTGDREHVLLPGGQCFFPWLVSVIIFFSSPLTIWTVLLRIYSIFSLGSVCQHSVPFGARQAGFKFRKAESRLRIGKGSYVSCFDFQNYPPGFIAECWPAAVRRRLGPLGSSADSGLASLRNSGTSLFIWNLSGAKLAVLFLEIPI